MIVVTREARRRQCLDSSGPPNEAPHTGKSRQTTDRGTPMIRTFHRRTLAALAAGASLLALGDAALAQGKYKEAPALADQVKAGKLPAVDARLPETPLLVPTVEKVGEYGG